MITCSYQRERRTITALKILVLLNLFDLLSTMTLFERNVISEGNPLMAYFLSTDTFLFSLVKVALVYIGVAILYAHRRLHVTFYVSVGAVIFYGLIVMKHFWIYLAAIKT
jgi:hypothetical protein